MRLKKILLKAAGFALLGLGAVGVVLPVLPTTPFVLLAAVCFSASDQKIYTRLKNNRVFGPYIENYQTKRGITRLRKAVSIAFVWVMLGISALMVELVWVYAVLGVVGLGVTIHLLMIKTRVG